MTLSKLAPIAAAFGLTAVAADLVITSVERNGNITWTNAVSNATYQVQWSNAITGSWTNFQSLRSLDSIRSTNPSVTAQLPTFYRVLARENGRLNAAGLYQYESFDAAGAPLLVGWFTLLLRTNGPSVDEYSGKWSFGYVGPFGAGDPAKIIGAQIGQSELRASVVNDSTLSISLRPGTFNYFVTLIGKVQDDRYTGQWSWVVFSDVKSNGTFSAQKVLEY